MLKDRDFIEMVLQERIGMLLCRTRTETEDDLFKQVEAIFSKLGEKDQEKVTFWQDQLCSWEAEDQKRAYLGGLRDGMMLMAAVMATGMEGVFSLGKEYKAWTVKK